MTLQTSSAAQAQTPSGRGRHWVVVGAGAFGGWTALHLLRAGARVTLVDAWGPGNSRASSGDETRVIRGMYGPDRVYTELTARSFDLWRESSREWQQGLYRRTGALWMFTREDGYARASLPLLADCGLEASELTLSDARGRFPQIDFDGVRSVYFEEEAGYLLARRACQAVVDAFQREGGEYRQLAASLGIIKSGTLRGVALSDGAQLGADGYVFACGPWLGRLFPDVIGNRIQPTRQEVHYFGAPAGDPGFLEESLPVWIHFGDRVRYGIPGSERRGMKIADDTRGEPFEPTSGERFPTQAGVDSARSFLEGLFPAMARAPLLEARVCQYENSPDGHFIVDRHPGASNLWLVGGGSGHGFKLGPALGEHVAAAVLGQTQLHARFALDRFAGAGGTRSTQFEHR